MFNMISLLANADNQAAANQVANQFKKGLNATYSWALGVLWSVIGIIAIFRGIKYGHKTGSDDDDKVKKGRKGLVNLIVSLVIMAVIGAGGTVVILRMAGIWGNAMGGIHIPGVGNN